MILRTIGEVKSIEVDGVNINNTRFTDDAVFLAESDNSSKIHLMLV